MFHPADTALEYYEKLSNICCLRSSSSAFHSIGDNMGITALANRTEESLTLQTNKFRNRIHFDNNIMTKNASQR